MLNRITRNTDTKGLPAITVGVTAIPAGVSPSQAHGVNPDSKDTFYGQSRYCGQQKTDTRRW